ncbi:MAG: NUDIX domain-containing protein [Rickettsiaceae bacterium]|nr:NUDIX domain-containing protein [Rickettsiaceae bacterium]
MNKNGNKIHVLTRAVIIDQEQILLCKIVNYDPNFYFLPGGHIENGESAKEALLRELKEETGADCNIERFLGCLECSFEPNYTDICHNHEYNFIFAVSSRLLKSSYNVPKLEDNIDLLWVPIADLTKIDFRPNSMIKL